MPQTSLSFFLVTCVYYDDYLVVASVLLLILLFSVPFGLGSPVDFGVHGVVLPPLSSL